MRTLIVLTSIILLVACATTPTVKSVTGTYEGKNDDRDIIRILFHKNGVAQGYTNGEKDREGKWKIIGAEIHASNEEGRLFVLRINEDGSITLLAGIDADGKRIDLPKDKQTTFKKFK